MDRQFWPARNALKKKQKQNSHSMTMLTMKLVTAALLLVGATAIDVKLREIQCDDLPVTIAADDQFKIVCEDSGTDNERCSFNGDTAVLSGNFLYNGVDEAGLDGSTAYMTAELNFVSLQYTLAQDNTLDLCDENRITHLENYDASQYEDGGDEDAGDDAERRRLEDAEAEEDAEQADADAEEQDADADAEEEQQQDENAQCDLSDGYYAFQLYYTLPDYSDNMSWLATGWRGTGVIAMHTDTSNSDETKIGYCTFTFDTMVTQSDNGGMTPPTAAMTLAIIAGVFALGALLCCYMSCCRGKKKEVAAASDTTVGGSAPYKRTEDDGTFVSSKDGSTV